MQDVVLSKLILTLHLELCLNQGENQKQSNEKSDGVPELFLEKCTCIVYIKKCTITASILSIQVGIKCARTNVSDNLGLVAFAVRLLNSVLTTQVKILGKNISEKHKLQITKYLLNTASQRRMAFGLGQCTAQLQLA